jgi:hypothetical protein
MSEGGEIDVQEPLSYEHARERAIAADWQVRRDLALRTDAPAEILFFLANDGIAQVRTAVALNQATPAKGNLVLAADEDVAVRMELAAKIAHFGRMVGVSEDQARSKKIMDAVLLRLADDVETRIRVNIAVVLKDTDDFDKAAIRRLANDRQIAVAAPILQYSPLLSDDDLLALIASAPIEGVLAAIARRRHVDARITAAIVASSDPPAIGHLLRNANVNLQEDTLDALIEGASAEQSWQEPLVFRRELSEAALDRVVEMAAPHVLDRILSRQNLPEHTASTIAKAIEDSLRQRPSDRGGDGLALAGLLTDGALDARYRSALDKMRALRDEGQLDEMALTVSLLTDHTDDLVAGLAVLANIDVRTVLDIAAAQSARAICALAWAAGLSAAFAVDLQMRLGNIPAGDALQPITGDGYRLSDEEMTWQLDMFRTASVGKINAT